MIYFDSAATSYYRPDCVAQAVAGSIRSLGNPFRGHYGASLEAGRMLLDTRSLIAELVHADGPDCVAFAQNTTMALNTAVCGLLRAGDWMITTVLEHNSVLRPAYRMEKAGVHLQFAGADEKGRLDYGSLARLLGDARRRIGPSSGPDSPRILVAVTHASNLTGNRTDIGRVGQLCREFGAIFLLDAAQSIGCLPIDMRKAGVDVLCFPGHKSLMGPQGTGGLAVRRGLAVRPLLTGGTGIQTFRHTMPEDMPARLEAGTQNAQGIAGLHAALVYARGRRAEFFAREDALRKRVVAGVGRINDSLRRQGIPKAIRIYGDQDQPSRAPIVALNIGDEDSAEMADLLWQENGIATRPGGHCAPLMHRHFGTEEQGMVRVSISHYNTERQVDTLLKALEQTTRDILL